MGSVHSSPALSNKARTPTGRHTVYRHSLKPTALSDSQQPADRPPPCERPRLSHHNTMAQQWPSFPSEQGRRLQQFVCAPTSRSLSYQQPPPTAWDGRALPSAHGRTTQSAFLFLGPTTQSAFPSLGPKMESSVLEGGGFWICLAPIA